MGTKASTTSSGVCTPMITTTKPRVAAIEYAGAVDASPTAVLVTRPMAFFFSPFGSGWSKLAVADSGRVTSVTGRTCTPSPSFALLWGRSG